MLLSGAKLHDTHQIYQIGDESYKSLVDQVRPAGLPVFRDPQTVAKDSGGLGTEPGKKANVEIPVSTIDFDTLRSINPDAVAWLYCPDTVIDYPIVRATDYNHYLHRLPDGTFNANGTLFTDYNWKGFSDQFLIVYGHNMKSGLMFGSLSNYKRQDYFNAHPYLYLYTEEGGNYRVDLMYGCIIGAGQWRDRAFMFDVNLDSFLAYAAHNTTFISETQYAQGDKVIVLSTCSYEFDNARYVVVGILRPEY
jgi:sortase B